MIMKTENHAGRTTKNYSEITLMNIDTKKHSKSKPAARLKKKKNHVSYILSQERK